MFESFSHACDVISDRICRHADAPLSDEEFDQLATALFRLQANSIHIVRSLCELRGIDIDSIKRWQEIPAIPVSAFKEFTLTSLPVEEQKKFFVSSGTTRQQRSRHYHDQQSLEVYEASLEKGFQHQFLIRGDDAPKHLLSLTPSEQQAPASSLVHMFHTLGQEMDTATFVGTTDEEGQWQVNQTEAIEALQKACAKGESILVVGTAFGHVHLLDALNERGLGFELPEGSLVLETGGYKGQSREIPKQDLHQMLSAAYRLGKDGVVCEYGMSELSSQAYARDEGCFRFSPWSRVELLSPETGKPAGPGEVGMIRVVDLANVCSVCSVWTEDLGLLKDGGLELIGRRQSAEAKGCSLMAV